MDLNEIVSKILASPERGTARVSGTGNPPPDTGYLVGNSERGLVCPTGMMSRLVLLGAVIHLHTDARFIGWRTDGDRFRIEPSDWTSNHSHAFRMALERGEPTFFDVARQADVRVDA